MKSIRLFLIIVLLASMTLLIFISALNGYQDSMAKAEQLFDSQLKDKAHLLSISFPLVQQGISTKTSSDQLTSIEITGFAFQVWSDNQLLLHSKNTPNTPLIKFTMRLEEGFFDVNFANNRWRVYSYYDQISNLWILAADRADLRYVIAENIILESVLPVVFMLPVLGILIWSIISFGLSPLRKLANDLGNKQADDLSPLRIDKQPAELIQLIHSTNDLFRRLKASFYREKRFASDAAHELRTPISSIKIHLHNLIQHDKHDLEEQQNLTELQLSVDRMEHLVEQILNLNRISPEQYSSQFKIIDLNSLAQQVIAREYHQFEDKKIQLALEGGVTKIEGDYFALDVLLQNLLTNACKYTPNNGEVLVRIINNTSTATISIEDSGPGVPAEQYERLFDRFYRLDGDCHASGTIGCGLGLAIVQQIVELHQAEISLAHSEALNGLKVCVIFNKILSKENLC